MNVDNDLIHSSFQTISSFIGVSLGTESSSKDFSYSVTLFEKKCLYEPKLLFYSSVLPMAVILTALLTMALLAAKLKQLRLILCERFFSAPAEERVKYLHAKILRKRSKGSGADSDEGSLRALVFKVRKTKTKKSN